MKKEEYKIDDLILNIRRALYYDKFHKHKLSNELKVNVNGGGSFGRSEHGSAHFDLTIDNLKIEIYLPGCDDIEIPKFIDKLDYKKNKLDKKTEKNLIKILSNDNMHHLIKIAELWNKVNEDNPVPGLKKVNWA